MAGKSAIEWAVFLAQVRPPLCGKRRAHRVFCIFPPVYVGLGWAAGDAFFGLIGFRCETRAVRAPYASAGCKQAHALKLGWVSACSVSGGLGKKPCSLLCVWVCSERVLGWSGRQALKPGPAKTEFFLVLPISPVRPASAAGDGEAPGLPIDLSPPPQTRIAPAGKLLHFIRHGQGRLGELCPTPPIRKAMIVFFRSSRPQI